MHSIPFSCFVLYYIVAEICSVANGATKKEIGRAKEFIVKQLEVEMGQSMEMGTIHAGDFLVCWPQVYISFVLLSELVIFLFLKLVAYKLTNCRGVSVQLLG